MWDTIYPYLAAIVPTIVALTFFVFLIKAIIESDRRERLSQRQWEAAHGHPLPGSSRAAQSTAANPAVVAPNAPNEPADD